MIRRIRRFIFHELVYNGHLQSLGAVSIYWISALLINIHPLFVELVIIYLLFQSIFLFDRYRGFSGDIETNKARSNHLSIYLNKIPLLILTMLVLMFSLAYINNGLRAVLFVIIIGILGFLYPIYMKDMTKKVWLFKNVYVSVVYGVLVFSHVYLHDTYVLVDYSLIHYMFFAVIVFESMVNQITLDIKDEVADRKNRLLTLPALIGSIKTVNLIRGLVVTSAALYVVLSLYFKFNLLLILIVSASVGINLLIIRLISKKPLYSYILSACKFSTWLLVLFFANVLVINVT